MLKQDPTVTVDKVENKPVKSGTHKYAWLTVTGITPDTNTVSVDPGLLGVKRVDVLRPMPLGAPYSVAWDGDSENPGLAFDGWQDEETRVLVEVWGL